MKAKVVFRQLLMTRHQESDRPADNHIDSVLLFDLYLSEKDIHKMEVDVQQPAGFDYNKPDKYPLEIGVPRGNYKGGFHHESLRAAAEKAYRSGFAQIAARLPFPAGAQVRPNEGTRTETDTDEDTFRVRGFSGGIPLNIEAEIELVDKGTAW